MPPRRALVNLARDQFRSENMTGFSPDWDIEGARKELHLLDSGYYEGAQKSGPDRAHLERFLRNPAATGDPAVTPNSGGGYGYDFSPAGMRRLVRSSTVHDWQRIRKASPDMASAKTAFVEHARQQSAQPESGERSMLGDYYAERLQAMTEGSA